MTQPQLNFEPPDNLFVRRQHRKRDLLLACLQTGRKWSKGEIWTELGIWNSGDQIMKLRREGHDIKTEMVTKDDVTYAVYFIPRAV